MCPYLIEGKFWVKLFIFLCAQPRQATSYISVIPICFLYPSLHKELLSGFPNDLLREEIKHYTNICRVS